MTAIEVNRAVSVEEWRSYVERYPEGLFYHLPEWKETLQQSFRRQPFYLFARNNDGKLVGLLPLLQVNSPFTGNRLVSLPFSHTCGPIADSESIVARLISRAQELCEDRRCRDLEIRAMRRPPMDTKVSEYFNTYTLELSDDPSAVWTKLHQKDVRWATGKVRKDGATVRIDRPIEGVSVFSRLNRGTKKYLGVPAHPLVFLENMFGRLSEQLTLCLAEVSGRAIARNSDRQLQRRHLLCVRSF